MEIGTPISWKRGTLKTLVEREYLICSTPRLLEKELTHIRTVFRNTNGYPYLVINQVFEQVKAKQRDTVPTSNVSNENEVTQTITKQKLKNRMTKNIFL